MPRDPAIDRAALVGRTAGWVLGAAFIMAVGLSILSLATTPLGWMLTAGAALFGLIPLARHRVHHAGATALPVWDLHPQQAEPVARAANQAERLRLLAERAPAGPVADHLLRLSSTADDYVVALHGAARQANLIGPDAEFDQEVAAVVSQLGELVEAAERLRHAQKTWLEMSPLTELTDETNRLAAIIEAESTERPAT